jgi:hypothetical protein
MGIGSARPIGMQHPLFVIDTRQEGLDQAIEALRDEGYVVSGRTCDITDAA